MNFYLKVFITKSPSSFIYSFIDIKFNLFLPKCDICNSFFFATQQPAVVTYIHEKIYSYWLTLTVNGVLLYKKISLSFFGQSTRSYFLPKMTKPRFFWLFNSQTKKYKKLRSVCKEQACILLLIRSVVKWLCHFAIIMWI